MSHPQQERCQHRLEALAGKSDLRIINRNGNCYVFVSDHGAQVLKDEFDLESRTPPHLQQVFKGYELGRTPHHIAREDLIAVVGRFGLGDALRGVRNFIPEKRDGLGEGRA